jgi:gliding motility-associated-like protein
MQVVQTPKEVLTLTKFPVLIECKWPLAVLFCIVSYSVHSQHADFSITEGSSCAHKTVAFTDNSTGTITHWDWNFGNTNTESYSSPPVSIHAVYDTPGTYTVSLTVSNGSTTNTFSKDIVIYDNPVAEFNLAVPAVKCVPLTVGFTDASSDIPGSVLSYQWIFGDGGSSSEKSPSYTYNARGLHTVTLLVTNQHNCDNAVVKSNVVEAVGIFASFTTENDGLCTTPASVKFTADENATSYQWNFGDGGTAAGQSATHKYQNTGHFNASLTSVDANGCVDTKTREIVVGNPGGIDFLLAEKACINSVISITETATDVVLSRQWNFGDGTTSTDLNPQHHFTKSGTYSITLTALLAGKACNSILSKKIEVIPDVVPGFKTSSKCTTEIFFNNVSLNSTSWSWNFGDGATSTEKSPSRLYEHPGNYHVTLQAYNALGCYFITEKDITVNPPPVAAFTPDSERDCLLPSLSGCAPFTVTLENKSSSKFPLTKVQWNFGDGAVSSSANNKILHTYDTGSFALKLTIVDSLGCESSFIRTVTVKDVTPVAKFSMDTTEVCVNQPVIFKGLSELGTLFCWDFGDGLTSTGKVTAHGYEKPGLYDVTFTAKNAGCQDSDAIVQAIKVKGPYVEFKPSKNCDTPYNVSFTNNSDDYDSLWWDFGDGIKDSVSVNPIHQYGTTGDYSISLRAKSLSTGCNIKVSSSVTIQEISAGLLIDKTNVCLGDSVFAKDDSKFAARWEWNMGNNTPTITISKAAAVYNTPGDYDIKLLVTDSDGCIDQTSVTITVLDIQGDFDFTALSFCDPEINSPNDSLQISFQGHTNSADVLTWDWTFGDGSHATNQNPIHAYYNPQPYSVSVRISETVDRFCNLIRPNYINYTKPSPGFTIADSTFCIGERAMFINTTTGVNNYTWDFGNGQTSKDMHPYITFDKTDTLTITLKAKDALQCEKIIKKSDLIYITKPNASFTVNETFSDCPPLQIQFFSDHPANVKSWKWDFGDGQISGLTNPKIAYQRPGSFDVTLIETDVNGCSDTTSFQKLVTVGGPDGTISVSPLTICLGDTVYYEANSEKALIYRWDFGDGPPKDFLQSSTFHRYEKVGQDTVSATFIDNNRCQVEAPITFVVTVLEIPDATYTYKPEYPFQNEAVTLEGVSKKGSSFQWIVDHNIVSTDAVTSVKIEDSGSRTVTFRASDQFGCSKDTTQQIFLQANIDFIPNIFTPNGDELHQTFEIPKVIEGYWNIYIYNRWGELVYKDQNYQNTWEANGLAAGVYFYVLSNNFRDKKYKGYVHVVY